MKTFRYILLELKNGAKPRKNLSLILLLIIYSFLCGSNLSMAEDAGFTIGEYILYMISDHYYLIYGLFFFFLYDSFVSLQDKNNVVLIRYGSLIRYYFTSLSAELIRIACIVLCHLLIPFFLSFHLLKPENIFAAHKLNGYVSSTLSYTLHFKDYFLSPVSSIAFCSMYLILGLFFIYCLQFFIRELANISKVIMTDILIVGDTLLGFKLFGAFPALEPLFLNCYFILHHPLFSYGLKAVCINIVIGVTLTLSLLIMTQSHNRNQSSRKMNQKVLNIFPDLRVLASFSSVAAVLTGVLNRNSSDFLFASLKGYSSENVNLTEILYYLTFFVFPVIYINIVLEKEQDEKTDLMKFRFGSRKLWDRKFLGSILQFILKYVMVWDACFLAVYLLLCITHSRPDSKLLMELYSSFEISTNQFYQACMLSLVLKIFELITIVSIDTCLSYLLRNQVIGFLLTFALYPISIILCNVFGKTPFYLYGGSSLYYIFTRKEKWISLTIRMISACVLSIILSVFLRRIRNGKSY